MLDPDDPDLSPAQRMIDAGGLKLGRADAERRAREMRLTFIPRRSEHAEASGSRRRGRAVSDVLESPGATSPSPRTPTAASYRYERAENGLAPGSRLALVRWSTSGSAGAPAPAPVASAS